MNRTRRHARRLLLALFVAFLGVLVVSYRKTPGTVATTGPAIAGDLLEELPSDSRGQLVLRDFDSNRTGSGAGDYRLRAAEAVGYKTKGGEQLFRLKDALFESKDGERAVAILAPRAEFNPLSKAVRVFDGFRIDGDGITLHGLAFQYDPKTRVFASDGPVTAMRGEITARAESGRIETQSGALLLTGNVRLTGRAETGPIDLSAPDVRMARDGGVSAKGGVVMRSADSVLRSDTFERHASAEGDVLRAEGSAWLLSATPSLPAALLAQGDVIELARDEAGKPISLALRRETEDARVDMVPGIASGGRTAMSRLFEAAFVAGRLREINAPGKVSAAESASKPDGVLRTIRAGSGRLVFQADGETLDVATFDGGLELREVGRSALMALRGTLQGADQTAIFNGTDGGEPADFRDATRHLRARTIQYHPPDERIVATGDVKVEMRNAGGALPGADAKLPIFTESKELELLGKEKKATLTGSVRAWQGENVLQCRKLFLDGTDGANRKLRAEDSVKAFIRRKGAGVRGGATDTINAAGNVLTYAEAERLARIEGSASIVSGSWSVTSDVTDVKLTADQAIERVEARGHVVVEDRVVRRHGEGGRALWTPQPDVITLLGGPGRPAVAVDEKGNRVSGAILRFRQGRSQVDVETGDGQPSELNVRPEKKS